MATKPLGTKLYKILNIFFHLLFLDHTLAALAAKFLEHANRNSMSFFFNG